MERNPLQTQIPPGEYNEAPPPQAPDTLDDQQMGSQGGYQPFAEGQQEQQQQPIGYGGYQQPYSGLAPGDIGPFEMTSIGMKARTAG